MLPLKDEGGFYDHDVEDKIQDKDAYFVSFGHITTVNRIRHEHTLQ